MWPIKNENPPAENVISVGGAIKLDADKLPLELLPIEALEEVGLVLQHGAKKYGANNWRRGMLWTRLLGAALRHLFAFIRGEDADEETGASHLAHCACCVLFLLTYQLEDLGEDNRWIKE